MATETVVDEGRGKTLQVVELTPAEAAQVIEMLAKQLAGVGGGHTVSISLSPLKRLVLGVRK